MRSEFVTPAAAPLPAPPDAGVRKKVIYAGGFGLPDRTASAQRCLGNAKLLRSIGFDVVIVGKLAAETPSQPEEMHRTIDGFECYDIRAPLPGRKFRTYVHAADPIEAVIRHLGAERVHSVIAYNYPARGLARLMQACRRLDIPTVVECTEWYGWEGKDPLHNVLRMLGSFWRSRVLAPRAGHVIVASQYLLKYYRESNVLVLPFVVDANEPKWSLPRVNGTGAGVRRFVYAGSPGLGLRKDKVNYLLESLATLRDEGHRFHLDVVGLTPEQYVSAVPGHRKLVEDRLAGCVQFHGRVPHPRAVELQRSADFSVFFRDPDRVASVGFPTKYVEAVACGIPSITNPTSDLPEYLVDGVNGFLARSQELRDITEALRKALALSDAELSEMKARLADNPFHYEHARWQGETRRFMTAIQ